MVINIYTALNGVGLEKDYLLLKSLMSNHKVRCYDLYKTQFIDKCDLAIHIEIPKLKGIFVSKKNILIPNPEWFYKKWEKELVLFDEIWCKTNDCYNIFNKLHPNCIYTSFISEDLYDSTIKREKSFIHVAGKSLTKGTEYVIKAYERCKDLPKCYLLSSKTWKTNGNLIPVSRLQINEFKKIINSNLFHLCPSVYEGWGHYIHEALGVGNIVLTTNHPPMNEFIKQNLIKISNKGTLELAETGIPSVDSIIEEIKNAMNLSDSQIKEIGDKNREDFLNRNKRFEIFIKSRIDNDTNTN